MPEPVAELVEAARVVAPAQPVLLVEVGDIRHLGPQPPDDIGAAAARQLQLAEMPRERHLALVVEILAAQYQHGIAVDRRRERPHGLRVERPPGIEAANLADKQRVQRAHRDFHRDAVPLKP